MVRVTVPFSARQVRAGRGFERYQSQIYFSRIIWQDLTSQRMAL